jgi:hypothetical protein
VIVTLDPRDAVEPGTLHTNNVAYRSVKRSAARSLPRFDAPVGCVGNRCVRHHTGALTEPPTANAPEPEPEPSRVTRRGAAVAARAALVSACPTRGGSTEIVAHGKRIAKAAMSNPPRRSRAVTDGFASMPLAVARSRAWDTGADRAWGAARRVKFMAGSPMAWGLFLGLGCRGRA